MAPILGNRRPTANAVIKALRENASEERRRASQWFFKTGVGQYGYGDVFLGVNTPDQRKIAKQFSSLPLKEIEKLLDNKVHEVRHVGLHILVIQYAKADTETKKTIASFYVAKRRRINNWDLVDTSAPHILGDSLVAGDKKILYTLARSRTLWERRIAIISTFAFIKRGQYTDTLAIAEILLSDPNDLIHKAVGWALREVGNKSLPAEEAFLKKHASTMPRTMLRYAIEKFPETKRLKYLTMR